MYMFVYIIFIFECEYICMYGYDEMYVVSDNIFLFVYMLLCVWFIRSFI